VRRGFRRPGGRWVRALRLIPGQTAGYRGAAASLGEGWRTPVCPEEPSDGSSSRNDSLPVRPPVPELCGAEDQPRSGKGKPRGRWLRSDGGPTHG
jgi:hypothetical protein